MEDAVHYRILEEIRDCILQAEYEGFGEMPGIPPEHIVLRHIGLTTGDPEETDRDEATPGIVISPGDASAPAEAGTNEQDDIWYNTYIQLIDRGDGRMYEDQLRSHLLWIQLIRRALHGKDWAQIDTGDGCSILSWAEQSMRLESENFYRHKFFVKALLVKVWVREPRGLS